nr:MAG TPA: hypothetical protein [Caudoviricetes sp.]
MLRKMLFKIILIMQTFFAVVLKLFPIYLIRTMIVLMSLFLILQEKAVILIQYLLLLKLLRNVLL